MDINEYISRDGNTGFLKVKITPSSSKNEIFNVLENGVLKIRIKAVPEKGKANKELVKFLSKELSVKKENIEILSGSTGQIKIIKIIFNN